VPVNHDDEEVLCWVLDQFDVRERVTVDQQQIGRARPARRPRACLDTDCADPTERATPPCQQWLSGAAMAPVEILSILLSPTRTSTEPKESRSAVKDADVVVERLRVDNFCGRSLEKLRARRNRMRVCS
jgi:hypothetical protein